MGHEVPDAIPDTCRAAHVPMCRIEKRNDVESPHTLRPFSVQECPLLLGGVLTLGVEHLDNERQPRL
jgi:hypothetical protein